MKKMADSDINKPIMFSETLSAWRGPGHLDRMSSDDVQLLLGVEGGEPNAFLLC
jgi:hypothetical protein